MSKRDREMERKRGRAIREGEEKREIREPAN